MDLATPKLPDLPQAADQPFLVRIDGLIDWSSLAQSSGEDARALGEVVPIFALKIALLKLWYGLSDQEANCQVLDRISWRNFVGFVGDDSEGDALIRGELNDGAWSRHPAVAEVVEEVETQLKNHGYAVRHGHVQEPSLAPCTESGADVQLSGPTTLFRPGELGRMVEAVTAKAHADGVRPPAQGQAGSSGTTQDLPAIVVSDPASQRSDQPVLAVLEWPWGLRSELAEHLNIGRDFQFSPLARELTPYTHVSRRHAELLVYGDGVWVRDLGSRNGTYVNDEEVPKGQAYLIDADSILRFGPLLAVSLKLSA